ARKGPAHGESGPERAGRIRAATPREPDLRAADAGDRRGDHRDPFLVVGEIGETGCALRRQRYFVSRTMRAKHNAAYAEKPHTAFVKRRLRSSRPSARARHASTAKS